MSFDTSRFRFDPTRNYSGVVMEQGRVQLDSDWNEWLAQLGRRTQAETLDFVGRAAYPPTTPFAFLLQFDGSGNLTIGPGRMYVDGLLAENHGDPAASVWDPALAEKSNTPQPPPSAASGAIDYTAQPFLPGVIQPTDSGSYLAYLDVWTRAVNYLQDPALIDPAVGIDTTGRLQTVWQVRLASVASGAICGNAGTPWPAPSSGLLTTAPINSTPSGPCCLTTNTGYTGPENQNYRVEIHTPGPVGTATFKWSRDNGSVETGVTAITPVTNSVLVPASQLSVLSMGRDQVLGFAPGDWIEILDDSLELAGLHGDLHRIDSIDFAGKTITLDSPADATKFPVSGGSTPYQTDSSRHTRIRRWDQSGKVYQGDNTTVVTDLGAAGSTGEIPVTASGIAVILENGITVSFDVSTAGGSFNIGDYWTFAARTGGSFDQFAAAPPQGIHHHYTPLSVVDFATGSASDCRTPWGPGGKDSCGCCTVTVGEGGQYAHINDALAALPANGGEVCILPGIYYEHVFIEGLKNVVIRGCGYQTRLASPSLSSTPPAVVGTAAPTGGNIDETFNAVISITGSEHIILHDFAVEADANEVGILLDGTGDLVAPQSTQTIPGTPQNPQIPSIRSNAESNYSPLVIDVTVHDLFLTGSTLPAILSKNVILLRIDDNRVLMQNVRSLWPSIYVGGDEMHLNRNYVGLQTGANIREWLPTTVAGDLSAATYSNNESSTPNEAAVVVTQPTGPIHPGGILIAGRSREVFVCENDIDNGRFNGITLGSYALVDNDGTETTTTIGTTTVQEEPCNTVGTLEPPESSTTGKEGTSIVAGGPLAEIVIDRNRISNFGLCGIGPVGFFDLRRIFEVISIENLTITNNIIRDTVQRSTAVLNTFGAKSSQTVYTQDTESNVEGFSTNAANYTAVEPATSATSLPYAAICVPDVQNLIIHDNAITNFGEKPGLANGIFVLNGEMVDISRNQVLETRDWESADLLAGPTTATMHGGIILAIVTPPQIPDSASSSAGLYASKGAFSGTLFEPGMPAMRVQENVVRIPIGQALVALGIGSFAITNNHFTCGGMVRGRGITLAQTVLLLNFGVSIESLSTRKLSDIYTQATNGSFNSLGSQAFSATSNGTVLFSNNICQLEARANRQHSITSALLFTTDHLTATGNHFWFDSVATDAYFDAMLLGGSVNVSNNRFQESPLSVPISGATVGLVNITTQNISTFCLLVLGPLTATINQSNLALNNIVSPGACDPYNTQGQ